MKKNVVKYSKFFLSIILVFCLSIHSFALEGDSSAFVTKSEVDRALSEFNERLTTFEAGINSKIDSQVTSYLDRNGIWSGKEQTLTNEKYIIIKDTSQATTALINAGYKYNGTSFDPTQAWPQRVVVNKLNKSGLAYIYIIINEDKSVLASGQSTDFTGSYVGSDSARTYSCVCIGRASCHSWWHFQQKNEVGSYVGDKVSINDPAAVVFSVQQQPTTDKYGYGISYPYKNTVCQLFVSKNNSLWTYGEYAYVRGQYSTSLYTASSFVWNTGYNSASNPAIKCYISKIIVY